MDTLKDSPKDSIETTDARHLRLIDQHGHEQSRCTFAEFIRDNEREDGGEEALLDVYQALANARNPTCWIEGGALAHAWLNLGAGGIVGLVLEAGPVPLREKKVCDACLEEVDAVEAADYPNLFCAPCHTKWKAGNTHALEDGPVPNPNADASRRCAYTLHKCPDEALVFSRFCERHQVAGNIHELEAKVQAAKDELRSIATYPYTTPAADVIDHARAALRKLGGGS